MGNNCVVGQRQHRSPNRDGFNHSIAVQQPPPQQSTPNNPFPYPEQPGFAIPTGIVRGFGESSNNGGSFVFNPNQSPFIPNPPLKRETPSVGGGSSRIRMVNTAGNQYPHRDLSEFNNSPKQSAQVMLVALYDYVSRADGDLGFAKGDLMILVDDKNSDWWYVTHCQTGKHGYVPRNFVAKKNSHESEEWFHGTIQRNLAELLIKESTNPRGTFLVREREGTDGEFALTTKDLDPTHGDGNVKHYKIKRLENGGYYITTRRTFDTLQDLVLFYKDTPDGLCCRLSKPARKMAADRTDLSQKTQKDWEIPRDDLSMIRKLGSGNFGEVWFAKYQAEIEVAVKTLKPGTMSPSSFMEEARIMKQCRHHNLVQLFAIVSKEEPMLIVTEFMVNGSLLEYLRSGNGAHLPVSALIDITAQVAKGMNYLETRRMVHRDLAARNVLVGEEISGVPRVKVADFGLARVIVDDEYHPHHGAKFPIKWTAPEAALLGKFTLKSDVWSFGVLMFEIFSRGQVPYPGMANREVIEQVDQGLRLSQPRDCPDPVYERMLKSFDANPDLRPSFQSLADYFDDFFVASEGGQYRQAAT